MIISPKKQIRFWSKVEKTKTCWIWKGYKNKEGYGRLSMNNISMTAYRLSYEMLKGEIPKGLTIDHLCRNRACVNPEHLEIVSKAENTMRGFGACANFARRTHCSNGHELREENLVKSLLKYGWRKCRICYNQRWIIAYHKRRLKGKIEDKSV